MAWTSTLDIVPPWLFHVEGLQTGTLTLHVEGLEKGTLNLQSPLRVSVANAKEKQMHLGIHGTLKSTNSYKSCGLQLTVHNQFILV